MYRSIKRLIDVVGAFAALVLTAPLCLLIATAIRLTMGRPVFFRQMRPGLKERLFTLLKFRTMSNACDADGMLLSDEERATRLGRLLSRSGLHKLPQFWNVLRGDMSFVGPRPLFVRYLPHYTQEERRRHSVRPGLTGWAEVNGRNSLSLEQRLEMDIWYVDHLSFWLDLRILIRAPWMLLMGNAGRLDTAALDELRSSEAVHFGPKADQLLVSRLPRGTVRDSV